MAFDVKFDGRHRARIVGGGHVTELDPELSYSSIISTTTALLAMIAGQVQGKLKIGSIVALVETQGSRKFRLGKVLKEANDWHTVHLFAAQKAPKAIRAKSSRPAGQAKFKLAHVDPSDGMLVFDKRFTKWTMQFDTNEKRYGLAPKF